MLDISKKSNLIIIMVFMSLLFFLSIWLNYFAIILSDSNAVHSIAEMSDKYFTLITPISNTFGIWGLIYALGITVMIYMWQLAVDNDITLFNEVKYVVYSFMIISVLNPMWIFAWVNEKVLISWIIMLLLFLVLMITVIHLRTVTTHFLDLLRLFYSIYWGWISVAFSINTASLLINKNIFKPFDTTSVYIAIIILAVLTLVTILYVIRKGNFIYASVILYAFMGIYLQKDPRVVGFIQFKSFLLGYCLLLFLSIIYSVSKTMHFLRKEKL